MTAASSVSICSGSQMPQTPPLENQASRWAYRARMHYREYLPDSYRGIEDKDRYFSELGQQAMTRIEAVYEQISRPGPEVDLAALKQAEETVGDLVYPDPRTGPRGGLGGADGGRDRRGVRAGRGHDQPAGLAGSAQPVSFRPASQKDLAPAGSGAKIAANLEALAVVRRLETERRAASRGEMAVLARWSGWGSAPELFDPGSRRYRSQAAQLRSLLSEREWDAARRTTINAHYTSAEIVVAMWDLVTGLGFEPAGARVLEPGCGSGNFIGFAPAGVTVTGVELDPVTAKIAQALYPQATIRAESFADSPLADGRFDLVIGNVPFSSAVLLDRAHNRAGRSMHNHFVVKSLDLTRPGGLVAVVTSRFTLDAQADEARLAMAARADLIGAIRLPARTLQGVGGHRGGDRRAGPAPPPARPAPPQCRLAVGGRRGHPRGPGDGERVLRGPARHDRRPPGGRRRPVQRRRPHRDRRCGQAGGRPFPLAGRSGPPTRSHLHRPARRRSSPAGSGGTCGGGGRCARGAQGRVDRGHRAGRVRADHRRGHRSAQTPQVPAGRAGRLDRAARHHGGPARSAVAHPRRRPAGRLASPAEPPLRPLRHRVRSPQPAQAGPHRAGRS